MLQAAGNTPDTQSIPQRVEALGLEHRRAGSSEALCGYRSHSIAAECDSRAALFHDAAVFAAT